MSQLSMLRILPLLILVSPFGHLTAVARDVSTIVPMTLGQKYTGALTPSPSNPQGEICYGLSVEPNTRITLNFKSVGAGILKFAVYDQTKALRFFHNDVNGNRHEAEGNTAADSRFSFPIVSDVSQLCLTTTNPRQGQQYNFIATAKPIRKLKKRVALRPPAAKTVAIMPSKPKPSVEAPIPAKTPPAPTIEAPPPPVGEPYCYVGTWQIADLTGYWLPTIQTFTQAKVTEPQMLGYGKVTINKDGNAFFEAFDLEQKYTLKFQDSTKNEKIGLSIGGISRARYQANADGTLTFSSQEYQRLTTKLNLGASLKFTGDRLFMPFGDRDLPPVKLGYKCIDRDNIFLRIQLPAGQKTIPVALKRIN